MRFKGAVEESLSAPVQYMATIKNGRGKKSKYWNWIFNSKKANMRTNQSRHCPLEYFILLLPKVLAMFKDGKC